MSAAERVRRAQESITLLRILRQGIAHCRSLEDVYQVIDGAIGEAQSVVTGSESDRLGK